MIVDVEKLYKVRAKWLFEIQLFTAILYLNKVIVRIILDCANVESVIDLDKFVYYTSLSTIG